MKQHKNIPVIRFKDNNVDWKNVKLGTYSKFRRGSFPQPYGLKKWYGGDGAKPFVQVVDVTKNLNLVSKTKQTISVLAQPKSILASKGKIVVTLQGSIGRVAIIQYDAYVDRTLLIFEDFKNVTNEYFWAYSIQNIFEIEKTKAPGAIIKTITKEALSSFLISIPALPEQTQIGNFFKTINEQINLQEQKHQKLVNLKKAMLEKMFPNEGADVPEIRFKGFTEKWEEKRLEEVANIIGGGTPSTTVKEYWNGDLNWFSPTEIGKTIYVSESIKKITKLGLEKSSARILPAYKTILFTSRAGIGDMAILKKEAATNQGFQSFIVNNNFDVYFLFSLGNLIKKEAITKASGSTFLEISGKTLGTLSFKFPSFEEQQKIGTYFEQLDTLIQQSQVQIEKYKNIKQALLQKMFV